jgi:hypothetical protein
VREKKEFFSNPMKAAPFKQNLWENNAVLLTLNVAVCILTAKRKRLKYEE